MSGEPTLPLAENAVSVSPEPTVLMTGEIEDVRVPFQILTGKGKNQRGYSILPGPSTEAQQILYDRLSTEEKEAFEFKRLSTLKLIAGTLHGMPRLVGIVSTTGDSLSKLRLKKRNTTDDPRGPPAESTLPFSYRDRGYQAIQALLLKIDSQLFDHAPIIANANEFGFGAFGGVGAAAMIASQGWGDGHGLGLYVGYSPKLRQLTLELYWGREQMQMATVALKPPTAVLKLMVSGFRRRDSGEPPVITQARGYYPILVPGVGRVFVQEGAGGVHAGYAMGFSLVPGTETLGHLLNVKPLGTSLDGWTVKATRAPLLRVYLQLPKDEKTFSLTFHTAVDFRQLFATGWTLTRYAVTAPIYATAEWCKWAMKTLSGLCRGRHCEPPKSP